MKAAITAGLSMLLLTGAASQALAETVIQTTTTSIQASSACPPRQLSQSVVVPRTVVMPSVALDYLPADIDYSADFTWESTGGPFSDLMITSDAGNSG